MIRKNFKISVDVKILNEQEIKVPIEIDSLYKEYMKVYAVEKELSRKSNSVYGSFNVTQNKNGTLSFQKVVIRRRYTIKLCLCTIV